MEKTVELRCEHRILFGMLGDEFVEMKCRSERCGAGQGVVVIHRFSTTTGDLLKTMKFKDPVTKRKGTGHGTR